MDYINTIREQLTYNVIVRQLRENKLWTPKLKREIKWQTNGNIEKVISENISFQICSTLKPILNSNLPMSSTIALCNICIDIVIRRLPFGLWAIDIDFDSCFTTFLVKNINNLLSILVCLYMCDMFLNKKIRSEKELDNVINKKKYTINIF